MDDETGPGGEAPPSPDVIARLVANHRAFLGFLQARVRDRSIAEEILQAAFVRGLEKSGGIREPETAVAWFYRLLRNALIDHYRRNEAASRLLAPAEGHPEPAMDEELKGAVCACLNTLIPTLRPEYAGILEAVDLQERPLGEVADALGIQRNNAHVRLHRARQALRRQLEKSCGTCATHGCLDCHCGANPGGPAA